MKEKNDLMIVQNFSSEEFSKFISEIIVRELEIIKSREPEAPTEMYLTRKETAKKLQISLTCLNDWRKKGILTPFKLGNRTYFKWSDIEKKLNESNQNNDAA